MVEDAPALQANGDFAIISPQLNSATLELQQQQVKIAISLNYLYV